MTEVVRDLEIGTETDTRREIVRRIGTVTRIGSAIATRIVSETATATGIATAPNGSYGE